MCNNICILNTPINHPVVLFEWRLSHPATLQSKMHLILFIFTFTSGVLSLFPEIMPFVIACAWEIWVFILYKMHKQINLKCGFILAHGFKGFSQQSFDCVSLGPFHSEARCHGGVCEVISLHTEDRALIEEGSKEEINPSKSFNGPQFPISH